MTWIKQGLLYSKRHAQLPVVDVLNDRWRVYYSTRVNGRSVPQYLDVDPQKMLVTGESLTPILEAGEVGTFDHFGIMPTSIINIAKGIKFMYYVGWSVRTDVPYHNALGLAISRDNGETWVKYSNGPVLGCCHWEPGFVGTAEVCFHENESEFLMYYSSCRHWESVGGKLEPVYDLKIARSVDGINWAGSGTAIMLHPHEGGIAAARIKRNQLGYFKMWFSVRGKQDYRDNSQNSYRIEGATSYDGFNWKRTGPELLASSGESWDSEMAAYPYVIDNVNGLLMLYNGNGFGRTGIGFATCDNLDVVF